MSYTLRPEEFAQYQAYLQQLGPATGPIQAGASAGPSNQTQSFPAPPLSQITRPQGTLAASSSSRQSHQPAPISQPYQPIVRQSQPIGHPQPAGHPAGFHPFLGMNLPTANANQARMASASSTIPRSAALPRRNRRGPAQHPPALQSSTTTRKPSVTDTCQGLDINGAPILRLLIKVLPPPPDNHYFHQIYAFLHDSVSSFLTEYCLQYYYELAPTTTIGSLLQQVAQAMQSSDLHYIFDQPRAASFIAPHEALPLQVLGLVSRGITRRSSGEVRLRAKPVPSHCMLSELASNRTVYANPELCIENNRFIIHLTIRYPGVQFTKDGRVHRCLSHRFFAAFAGDGPSYPDHTIEDETSGGEDEHDTDAEMAEVAEVATAVSDASLSASQEIVTPVTPRYITRSASQSTVFSHSRQPFRQLERNDSIISNGGSFLPPEIWTNQPANLSQNSDPIYSIETLAHDVYAAATSGSGRNRKLDLEGTSLSSLVDKFEKALEQAGDANDYTSILLPNRTFTILKADGTIETMGAGIEREVLYTLFTRFRTKYSAWFSPRADSRATLQTSRRFIAARLITPYRLTQVKMLGALCALLLIAGISPEPFNPLLFYLLIHDFDLKCLHRNLVTEWHPTLRQDLDEWLALGPAGDPMPFRPLFLTWLDMDVGVLAGRDEASHKGYASEILWSAIVGQEPPSHPELKAFAAGFRLSCRNGFRFSAVPKQFSGGASTFFTMLWTSSISGYDSIAAHICFLPPPSGFLARLGQALHREGITIESLITDFLQGSGIPCPLKFAEAKGGFSTLVDFDKIDTPGFRPRVFTWAITGCPAVDPASAVNSISIGAVDGSELSYADASIRQMMLAAGKISFRTCMGTARLPAPYILHLAQQTYPSSSPDGPQSFKEAFDYWLLFELLTAIGGHSIL